MKWSLGLCYLRSSGRHSLTAVSRLPLAVRLWVALLVWRCLSTASFVFCVVRRVKDYHNLLHHSSLLKKVYVWQVVLDKRFPLTSACFFCGEGLGPKRCWKIQIHTKLCKNMENHARFANQESVKLHENLRNHAKMDPAPYCNAPLCRNWMLVIQYIYIYIHI